MGDDRARSCSGCSRTVYNISGMSRREAEQFLLEDRTAECVKFYRREDGTIMTDDCPRALRVVRDRCRLAAKIVFGMFAFCISLPAAFTQSLHNQSPMLQSPESYASRIRTAGFDRSRIVSQRCGGYMGNKVLRVTTDSSETDRPTFGDPKEPTVSVSARIVTKEHETPKGKVVLVDESENGKVIQVDRLGQSREPQKSSNRFLDTRAADFYAKAYDALANKDSKRAEEYFLKTLEAHDKQQNADPEFRNQINAELEHLRLREQKQKALSEGRKPTIVAFPERMPSSDSVRP